MRDGLPRNLDPGPLREGLYCRREVQVLVVHQEADGRAVSAAPEAVKELFLPADGEGRGLFVVKGAARLIVFARLL